MEAKLLVVETVTQACQYDGENNNDCDNQQLTIEDLKRDVVAAEPTVDPLKTFNIQHQASSLKRLTKKEHIFMTWINCGLMNIPSL